jgi:hypothetical protein
LYQRIISQYSESFYAIAKELSFVFCAMIFLKKNEESSYEM